MNIPQGTSKNHSTGGHTLQNNSLSDSLLDSALSSMPDHLEELSEKFPAFNPSKNKSRSLTQAEVQAATMTTEDINEVASRLRTEDPPLTLEQARERRASLKEDRKACVDFIKVRTTSRAAAMTRPNLEDLTQKK